MPICSKCEALWKDDKSLGWYEMLPTRKGTDMNILVGPYCEKCAKKILVEREEL